MYHKEKTDNFGTNSQGWNFHNSYVNLPSSFFACLDPVQVSSSKIVFFNSSLARFLGLNPDELESDKGAAIFSGNQLPENAEPLAMAYSGHQFGYFTVLGDGRAILLGEQITPQGERFDIQLKGSGRTPFSRGGDGRAALGPMLREYIISEAMYYLGIPTTRALAVVTTGENVMRQTLLPGAILTRVASSHIRVGTFEAAARQGGVEDVKILAEYTINRHFPDLKSEANPCLALLQAAVSSQASLVAKWQCVGFIHGVMNTDNMALSGETIDYGPCAFMDSYDPATVFSSIDQQGRYSYGNQPRICQWNLTRFAETLLPLISKNENEAIKKATRVLESFPEIFESFWLDGMKRKLGMSGVEKEDPGLIEGLLSLMQKHRADFTNTFRNLHLKKLPDDPLFHDQAFAVWHGEWMNRLKSQSLSINESYAIMDKNNPAVIPRNHRVEEALEAAESKGDYSVMHSLMSVLATPFEDNSQSSHYRMPPGPEFASYQTFCGT